jgi:hypothetical protein
MTTQWRSLTAVVAVDLASGHVSRVTPANGACWSLVASGSGESCTSHARVESQMCHVVESAFE